VARWGSGFLPCQSALKRSGVPVSHCEADGKSSESIARSKGAATAVGKVDFVDLMAAPRERILEICSG